MSLTSSYVEAVHAYNAILSDNSSFVQENANDLIMESMSGDEEGNNSLVIEDHSINLEEDGLDQTETNVDDKLAEEQQSDESEKFVVHMQEQIVNEQAIADFDSEFNKLIQESLEGRKNEKRLAAFDVAIPTMKGRGGTASVTSTANSSSSNVDEKEVVFNLLTKKGNKQQVRLFLNYVLHSSCKEKLI
jgi:hypothetical protein